MVALTKPLIMDFDIADYISYGGFSFLPGKMEPSYLDIQKIADETWKTKHGTIFTFNADEFSLEFMYDSNSDYIGDQIEFHHNQSEIFSDKVTGQNIKELPLSEFPKPSTEYKCIFDEGYYDENELILYARSGANVHFKRVILNGKEAYLLNKITSNNKYTIGARIMIENNLKCQTLDNIHVIAWP
jgi:hypothetical protein